MSTNTTPHDIILDQLPNHMLTSEDIFHLSSAIYENVGLASPIVQLTDHEQYDTSIIGFVLETGGKTKGYYYLGDKWEYTTASQSDFTISSEEPKQVKEELVNCLGVKPRGFFPRINC